MRKLANSNTHTGQSKSAKHLGTHSWKMDRHINILPDLPLDVILNIISRLPLKVINRCKSLSQAFNTLISTSNPSFNHTYLTNKSNYIRSIFVHVHKPVLSIWKRRRVFTLDLVEFDREMYSKRTRKVNDKVTNIFNSDNLPYPRVSNTMVSQFSIWGYCNGLFCLMILEKCTCNLFVINPIFGDEFFQLPDPLRFNRAEIPEDQMRFLSYGLGYCQLTNRFKVLRILTIWTGTGNFFKNTSGIFTIGSDQTWRKVSDVNVPHSISYDDSNPNPQSYMVAFCSALHWIVQPYPLSQANPIQPSWGGIRYICAFDMTEEKVAALPLPSEVAVDWFYGLLTILLDKLCLWEYRSHHDDIDLWVMDQYGIQGSWTKKFILKISLLPRDIKPNDVKPLAVSPQGVIVVSDCYKLLFFDLKKNKCLKIIHQSVHASYPIPFVPAFVSLKRIVQGG